MPFGTASILPLEPCGVFRAARQRSLHARCSEAACSLAGCLFIPRCCSFAVCSYLAAVRSSLGCWNAQWRCASVRHVSPYTSSLFSIPRTAHHLASYVLLHIPHVSSIPHPTAKLNHNLLSRATAALSALPPAVPLLSARPRSPRH